ncbi:MAG: hypothetical protein K2Q12_00245, partial [Rickettsiales bacterium]|nr:hypothetical protein [Rickettsiales bacterium]
ERNKLIIENVPTARPEVSAVMETVKAPEGAEKITLLLKEVRLEGVTAFNATEMQSFYKESLGKTVTLDKVWQIAAAITAHYRKEQFFLSRAYLPAQEIENGVVTIKVVEGYIAHVTISDELQKLRNVSQLIEKITASRPITAHQLEAFTLRLNDLPDARFFSVLRPLPDNHDGGVELVLKDEKKLFGGSVNFDNSGSRFLGPYQTSATLRANLLAQQETTLSVLNSIPTRELRYVALSHDVQLIPGWALELSGNVVEANPGSSLEENDINSESVGLGAGITYQPVRQYLENLRLGAYVDARNTNTDILGDIPLVRDRVRALRLGADYDLVDRWNGFNKINILFSQGIGVLGANDRGDDNLSRTEATPVFTTFQTDYTRHQALPYSLALVGQFSKSGDCR